MNEEIKVILILMYIYKFKIVYRTALIHICRITKALCANISKGAYYLKMFKFLPPSLYVGMFHN